MKTALTMAALLLAAGCASRALPAREAATDDTRARCRAQTAVQRAADLDQPGAIGPSQQPMRLGRPTPADADYANCLQRDGITP